MAETLETNLAAEADTSTEAIPANDESTSDAVAPEPVAVTGSPLIYLAEHTVYAQPAVTEVVYYKGAELIRARTVNPCPLMPGTGYTLDQIEVVLYGA